MTEQTKKKTFLFLGTPAFSVPSLKALNSINTIEITGVITQPDRPKGRGQKETASPVKQATINLNLPCYQPDNKESLESLVHTLKPDLVYVIAYGMILPKSLTDTYLCINSHASLLPLYRGASPLQQSLLHRDKETGITLIRMDEKMDEGNILATHTYTIQDHDYIQDVHDQLSDMSAELTTSFFSDQSPNYTGIEQEHKKATYCHKIKKEDMQVFLDENPIKTLSKIKAYSPGAFLKTDATQINILKAHIAENTLVPDSVKPAGKKAMSYHDYCLGAAPLPFQKFSKKEKPC